MGFFSKKKQETGCCCAGACTQQAPAVPLTGVQVLGSGCAKCNALEAAARQALASLGMADEVGHVTDFAQIAACGVMTTPALMVDGKVVSCGKVLTASEAAALIRRARGV